MPTNPVAASGGLSTGKADSMRAAPLLLAACLLAVGGSGRAAADPPSSSPPEAVVLHEEMKAVIAPQAQILWDVTNALLPDDEAAQAPKLADADWTRLIAAGQAIGRSARSLATAGRLMVARPGTKLQDEENPGATDAAQVGAFIAAERGAFSSMAEALALNADAFVAGARDRSEPKVSDAAAALDGICEACHTRFWYPQQNAQN